MLIVSPAFALFKQVWTLFESGVVVHVGLDPVQEHHANVPLRSSIMIKKTDFLIRSLGASHIAP